MRWLNVSRFVVLFFCGLIILFCIFYPLLLPVERFPFSEVIPGDAGLYICVPDTGRFASQVRGSVFLREVTGDKNFEVLCEEAGIKDFVEMIKERGAEIKRVFSNFAFFVSKGNMVFLAKMRPGMALFSKLETIFGRVLGRQRVVVLGGKKFFIDIRQEIFVMSSSQEYLRGFRAGRIKNSLRDVLYRFPVSRLRGAGMYLYASRLFCDLPVIGYHLRDFESGIFGISFGRRLNISGVCIYKGAVKGRGRVDISEIGGGIAFCLVSQVDFVKLFKDIKMEMGGEERERFEQDVKKISSEVLGGRDFYKDFLRGVGHEYGYIIERVDYDAYGIKPKYRLPAITIFVRMKDRWVREKFRMMVDRYYNELRVREARLKRVLPFTLNYRFKGGRFICEIKLREEEAGLLGKAFQPGYTFYRDYFIFTTFLPFLEEVEKQHFINLLSWRVAGAGYDSAGVVKASVVKKILIELNDYISETIVNNRYRQNIEPKVVKEIERRFPPEVIELKRREILKELEGVKNREAEADFRIAKFLYDKKIALIKEELSEVAKTAYYQKEVRREKREVLKWADIAGLIESVSIKSVSKGGYVETRIEVRR